MKFINRLRSFFAGTAAQKYWLAIAVMLAIVGQSLTREPQPLTSFKVVTDISVSLNKIFYLMLHNPTNILAGLFLIILASIIYSRLFSSAGISEVEQEVYVSDENWLSLKKFLPWLIANLIVYLLVMIPIAQHQYSNLLLFIWLINILVFTFIFWKNEQQNKADLTLSTTYTDGVWMLALFAFAIATGSYLLNDLPAGWIADEGPFWRMARSIALGREHPVFFDFGVFTFPVSSSILQGWIMRWAGVNMWGWRFASVLPAALTVIPLYLLTHELFGRRVAIIANVMMVVNPYFLTFARLGYNNSQALFPVTLCIFFLVIGIRKNSLFYLWLAGLTAGLGFYVYFASWLGLVVLVLITISLPWIFGTKFKKIIIPLAIIIFGVIVVFLPRILYGASSEAPILLHFKMWESSPINTFYGKYIFGDGRIAETSVFMLGNGEVEIFYSPALSGILVMRGLIRSAAVLFDPIGYFDHQIVFGLTGPGSSIFFILGMGLMLANFKKLQYLIPSIWFFAGFFFLGALSSFPPRPTHMVAVIPALSMISAIGLDSFLGAIAGTNRENLQRTIRFKKIASGSILLMIGVLSLFHFFILTPYAYLPPNTDDYISWLGRQIPKPANIYLVDHYSTVRNPKDEGFLKLSQHRVSFLTRSNLDSNPGQMEKWKNFVAFVEPKEGREYAEWIAQKIPGAHVQDAYVPGERLRGYIVTDIEVNTSMDISLAHGFLDLWNSPARIILILCGVGMIALLLKQRTVKNLVSNKIRETL